MVYCSYNEANGTEGKTMTTLTVEDTVRSYSGKVGCMCGCNGEYKDSHRARKLAITQLTQQAFEVDEFNRVDKDGTAGCMFVESNTRNRVLYLTQAGVIKAQAIRDDKLEEAELGHS